MNKEMGKSNMMKNLVPKKKKFKKLMLNKMLFGFGTKLIEYFYANPTIYS